MTAATEEMQSEDDLMTPRILSATQAAQILEVNTTTFQRWVARGTAPAADFEAKTGGFWLEDTILAYRDRRTKEAA